MIRSTRPVLSERDQASSMLKRVLRRLDRMAADYAREHGKETPDQIRAREEAMENRNREDRLRRRAKRLGLQMVKSRNRSSESSVFGTYGLVDVDTNAWVATSGGYGYGLSLVEADLAQREAKAGE